MPENSQNNKVSGSSSQESRAFLHNARTGAVIRLATKDEVARSREQATRDGGRGVIVVEGQQCVVVTSDDTEGGTSKRYASSERAPIEAPPRGLAEAAKHAAERVVVPPSLRVTATESVSVEPRRPMWMHVRDAVKRHTGVSMAVEQAIAVAEYVAQQPQDQTEAERWALRKERIAEMLLDSERRFAANELEWRREYEKACADLHTANDKIRTLETELVAERTAHEETRREPVKGPQRECARFVRDHLPTARVVARAHGYAIAVHGSLARDVDLVAVPWTDEASDADTLVAAISGALPGVNLRADTRPGSPKPHGRRAWTLISPAWPATFVDLSVTPRAAEPVAASEREAKERAEREIVRLCGALEDQYAMWTTAGQADFLRIDISEYVRNAQEAIDSALAPASATSREPGGMWVSREQFDALVRWVRGLRISQDQVNSLVRWAWSTRIAFDGALDEGCVVGDLDQDATPAEPLSEEPRDDYNVEDAPPEYDNTEASAWLSGRATGRDEMRARVAALEAALVTARRRADMATLNESRANFRARDALKEARQNRDEAVSDLLEQVEGHLVIIGRMTEALRRARPWVNSCRGRAGGEGVKADWVLKAIDNALSKRPVVNSQESSYIEDDAQ